MITLNNRITLTVFLVNLLVSISIAQSIDWVVDPVFTDVDMIHTEEKSQDPIKLIKVQKGKKYGFKNLSNEILLPIEYDRAFVWCDGEYMQAINGREQYFFDDEGYEVTLEEVEARESEIKNQKSNNFETERNKAKSLSESHPFFVFNIEPRNSRSYNLIILNASTLDTVLQERNFKKLSITEDNYIIKEGSVYDPSGEKILTFGSYFDITSELNGYRTIRYKKKTQLYDSKFNPLFTADFDDIKIIDDKYLIRSIEGKYQLIDYDGNVITPESGSYILTDDDNDWALIKGENETTAYNMSTGAKKTYNWSLKTQSIGSKHTISDIDTLRGIYDISDNKVLLPPSHRRFYIAGGVFVAGDSKMSKRKAYKYRQSYDLKHIYNSNGEKILSDSLRSVTWIGKGSFVVQTGDSMTKLYNTDGKLVRELGENMSVRLSKDKQFISIVDKSKKEKHGFVWVSEFIEDNITDTYQAVIAQLVSKDKKEKYYVVKKDEKYGILNADKSIHTPIVLDELAKSISYYKYIPAMYKGKWGIIRNPAR